MVPVGPTRFGLTFGVPTVLAACQHNALNSLGLRHLTEAPNRSVMPMHPCFANQIRILAEKNKTEIYKNVGMWKTTRPAHRVQQIEKSQVYDRIVLDKAKSFPKREVTTGIPTKARLIQGSYNDATAFRHPDMYRHIANTVKHLEFVQDGVKFDLHYTSGKTTQELASLLTDFHQRSGYHLYDERDGKNWDATMQEPLLRFEASLYAFFDADISEHCLTRSTHVKGIIKLKASFIKYITSWKRLSGDWNTSVGNTLISMAIIVTTILALPSNLRPRFVRGLFMGDDYIGMYEYSQPVCRQSLLHAMNHFESRCGITPVRGITTDPLKLQYISLVVWPKKDGSFAFTPRITSILSKLFYSIHHRTAHTRQDIISSCNMFLDVFRGCRFVERFLVSHRNCWGAQPCKSRRTGHVHAIYPQLNYNGLVSDSGIDWQLGLILKHDLAITSFDFDYPDPLTCAAATHPAVTRLYILERQDPDVRLA